MDERNIIEELKKCFTEKYGEGDVSVFFAPGRVNLIGEHTDYNGGHVFPCALTIGTYMAARRREDRKLRFYSMNVQGSVVSTSLDAFAPGEGGWTAYPKGVMWAFEQKGHKLPCGFDIAIYGNIPAGSGLSSSAALEVVTGYMLKSLCGFNVSNVDIALIGQYAENNYCMMNCGIMDQFASAMGRKDHAIFLNTADLSFEYAPMKMEGVLIVITNSNVKHSLVTSAYNDRRRESSEALKDIQTVKQVDTLGDMTEAEFEEVKHVIKDETCLKRGRHAVYENRRTIRAACALKNSDLEEFGRLMNEAHTSMSRDYEASCPEVDILAEEAWKIPGVIGSRITGGGFGGCTVSLVKEEAVDNFKTVLGEIYKNRTGRDADFYVVSIGDGPAEL